MALLPVWKTNTGNTMQVWMPHFFTGSDVICVKYITSGLDISVFDRNWRLFWMTSLPIEKWVIQTGSDVIHEKHHFGLNIFGFDWIWGFPKKVTWFIWKFHFLLHSVFALEVNGRVHGILKWVKIFCVSLHDAAACIPRNAANNLFSLGRTIRRALQQPRHSPTSEEWNLVAAESHLILGRKGKERSFWQGEQTEKRPLR